MKKNNTSERITVLTSHFTPSTSMASEKEAALAATPPHADSPTMYASFFSSTFIFSFSYCSFFHGFFNFSHKVSIFSVSVSGFLFLDSESLKRLHFYVIRVVGYSNF